MATRLHLSKKVHELMRIGPLATMRYRILVKVSHFQLKKRNFNIVIKWTSCRPRALREPERYAHVSFRAQPISSRSFAFLVLPDILGSAEFSMIGVTLRNQRTHLNNVLSLQTILVNRCTRSVFPDATIVRQWRFWSGKESSNVHGLGFCWKGIWTHRLHITHTE